MGYPRILYIYSYGEIHKIPTDPGSQTGRMVGFFRVVLMCVCVCVWRSSQSFSHFSTKLSLCLCVHGRPAPCGNGGCSMLEGRGTRNKPKDPVNAEQDACVCVCAFCVDAEKGGFYSGRIPIWERMLRQRPREISLSHGNKHASSLAGVICRKTSSQSITQSAWSSKILPMLNFTGHFLSRGAFILKVCVCV